jgi:cytochrome c553
VAACVALFVALSSVGLSGVASAQDAEADLDRGAELFDLCIKCHGAQGAGNIDVAAPAIAALPAWYIEGQLKKFKDGVRGLHAQDEGGLRMYPMSQWLRTEADQKAVAAYVASLPKPETPDTIEKGNAAQGAGYYAVCSACHGAQGTGNQAMGAPPLVGLNDWYLYSSIQKYKRSIRGSGKGDPYGAAMIGMVATLPNEDAILDVIAHIESLEK